MIRLSIHTRKGGYVAKAEAVSSGAVYEKVGDTRAEAEASLVRYLLRHGLISGVIVDPPWGND